MIEVFNYIWLSLAIVCIVFFVIYIRRFFISVFSEKNEDAVTNLMCALLSVLLAIQFSYNIAYFVLMGYREDIVPHIHSYTFGDKPKECALCDTLPTLNTFVDYERDLIILSIQCEKCGTVVRESISRQCANELMKKCESPYEHMLDSVLVEWERTQERRDDLKHNNEIDERNKEKERVPQLLQDG